MWQKEPRNILDKERKMWEKKMGKNWSLPQQLKQRYYMYENHNQRVANYYIC